MRTFILLAAVFLVAVSCTFVSAQEKQVPEEVWGELSADLFQIQREVARIQFSYQSVHASGTSGVRVTPATLALYGLKPEGLYKINLGDWVFKKLIFKNLNRMVKNLQDKYRNNQYVRITGFSLSLSISPSATLNFEFK